MKAAKILCVILTLALSLGVLPAHAEEASAIVTVSIVDGEGIPVLTQASVAVTDLDGDGTLTVSDALYAAHEAHYEGGAAGFAAAQTEYGLSLTKLWGDDSGSIGYYLNHASPMSLADPVKEGDTVDAFVYRDKTTWSDVYCWFDQPAVTGEPGTQVTLTLLSAGFDENWNPVVAPVVGATLLINGLASDLATDGEGKVTLTLTAGIHTLSATSVSQLLVTPVCKVTVTGDESTQTEEETTTLPESSSEADSTLSDTALVTSGEGEQDVSDQRVALVLVLVGTVSALFIVVSRNRRRSA